MFFYYKKLNVKYQICKINVVNAHFNFEIQFFYAK